MSPFTKGLDGLPNVTKEDAERNERLAKELKPTKKVVVKKKKGKK